MKFAIEIMKKNRFKTEKFRKILSVFWTVNFYQMCNIKIKSEEISFFRSIKLGHVYQTCYSNITFVLKLLTFYF